MATDGTDLFMLQYRMPAEYMLISGLIKGMVVCIAGGSLSSWVKRKRDHKNA